MGENKLRLPKLLGEGCVLQQGEGARIWGWGSPGESIRVFFQGQEKRTEADGKGGFEIRLDRLHPGRNFVLELYGEKEKLEIKAISVGEVLVCSGQSNMELPMERVRERFPQEFQEGGWEDLHIYKVKECAEFQSPLEDHREAQWFTCTKENLPRTSALAYFLGKELSKKKGIPVGILDISLGGTPAEAWTSKEGLAGCEDLLLLREKYRNSAYREKTIKERAEAEILWTKKLLAQEEGRKAGPWKTLQVPGYLQEQSLENFCGQLYLKKRFWIEKKRAGQKAILKFGTLADQDSMYLNGKFIGETGYRYPPRRYRIPQGLLKEGENEILIKLICQRGDGRITPKKDYGIFFEDGEAIRLEGAWQYQVRGRCEPAPEYDTVNRKPTGLFQGMVAPCLPFLVRGVVWYQGESNDRAPERYEELLKRLISDWRKQWKQDALPFVVIQLPGCGIDIAPFDAWPRIRQAQKKAEQLPHTGMTVNLDLGEANDLHPLDKESVAHRAYLAVQAIFYQENVLWKGPEVKSCKRKGKEIVVEFYRNGPGDLCIPDQETPGNFEAADWEDEFYPITGCLEKKAVRLFLKEGQEPKKIRYAWKNVPEKGLLYNQAGLPAGPFEISVTQEEDI